MVELRMTRYREWLFWRRFKARLDRQRKRDADVAAAMPGILAKQAKDEADRLNDAISSLDNPNADIDDWTMDDVFDLLPRCIHLPEDGDDPFGWCPFVEKSHDLSEPLWRAGYRKEYGTKMAFVVESREWSRGSGSVTLRLLLRNLRDEGLLNGHDG